MNKSKEKRVAAPNRVAAGKPPVGRFPQPKENVLAVLLVL
jgi:hypothetical protein